MTLSDYYNRNIPEYYHTMYLDGYTPEQIRYALKKKMRREAQEREAAKMALAESEEIPEVKISSVVKSK